MHTHSKGLGVALLLLTACGGSDPVAPVGANLHLATVGPIKFLTQATASSDGMEALFTGRLAVDDNGCIRLDSPDDAVVIWPHGYTLDAVSGVELVRDARGRSVGLLRGGFSLAGGEVAQLPTAMGFSQADESFLALHCPGRYWIVNGG